MNRGIYIAKIPFVSGKLTVRMHIPLSAHEQELVLRRRRIDVREHHAMEREIPSRIPGDTPICPGMAITSRLLR